MVDGFQPAHASFYPSYLLLTYYLIQKPMNSNNASDVIALVSAYRLTACVYSENAKLLQKSYDASGTQVEGNRITIPFYYLVSHSAELLLKCALLKRGLTRRDLMQPGMRHSLKSLLAELTSFGVPVSNSSISLLNSLEGQHERHDLRYNFLMEGKSIYTPDPNDCFSCLEELLMLTRISTHGL